MALMTPKRSWTRRLAWTKIALPDGFWGTIMDIGGWLRGLGLERYEATFRESEINEKVLPSLTAEDLKDMGVGIVGHRRTLLDAIALLRADASAKAPPAEPSIRPKQSQNTAERRQVTVMFS